LIDMGMGAEILLLDSGEDMIVGCKRVRCIPCSVERSLLCRGQRYFPFTRVGLEPLSFCSNVAKRDGQSGSLSFKVAGTLTTSGCRSNCQWNVRMLPKVRVNK